MTLPPAVLQHERASAHPRAVQHAPQQNHRRSVRRQVILLRLSTTIGALIAGALYEGFGPKIMYIIMGCSSIVALAFSAALRTIERRSEAKTMSS